MKTALIGLVIAFAVAVGGKGGTTCDWDLNNDGCVGTADLCLMIEHWFELDYNTRDLLNLLANWGSCPGGGGC